MLGLWAPAATPGYLHGCWEPQLELSCWLSKHYLPTEPFLHDPPTCASVPVSSTVWIYATGPLRMNLLLYCVLWAECSMFLRQWAEVTLSECGAQEKLGQSRQDTGPECSGSCLAFRRLRQEACLETEVSLKRRTIEWMSQKQKQTKMATAIIKDK